MIKIDSDFYEDLLDLLSDVYSKCGEKYSYELLMKHWEVRKVLFNYTLERIIKNGNSDN